MIFLASTSGAQLSATIAAWVTVGIYILLAIFAAVQVVDARKDRKAATRPYVFVDFDMSDAPMIWLILQNTGQTAAEDVKFTCDPPMTSTIGSVGQTQGILDKEWPYLPPRKEVRALYDSAIHRLADPPPLPLRYTVTAMYKDSRTVEIYTDRMVPDIEAYRNLMYTQQKDISDLVKSIDGLTKRFSDSDGLRVLVRSYKAWHRDREDWIDDVRHQGGIAATGPSTRQDVAKRAVRKARRRVAQWLAPGS